MTHAVLFLENDNVVTVNSLTDTSTTPAALITSAHLGVTLQDSAEVDIPGITWPLSLTNVGGGTYQATIPTSVTLEDGVTGIATAIIDVTSPVIARWYAPVAVTRRSL